MNDNIQTISGFLHFYPSRLSTASANSYNKAVRSFISFAGREINDSDDISETLLGDWVVDMVMSGLTVKTASYYLDCLCSIYNAAVEKGLASPSGSFRSIKSRLRSSVHKDLAGNPTAIPVTPFNIDALTSVIRTADRQTGELRLFTDIAIISLLNPALTLDGITRLKKRDIDTLTAESKAIAERHLDTRRSYIFPLAQTEKTQLQIVRRCEEKILSLLKYRGLPVSADAQDSLRTLWAQTALRSGIRASAAVAALGGYPSGIPILAVAKSICLGKKDKEEILEKVAKTLIENPLQWHVMRLRHGIKFESLKRRFEMHRDELRTPETFYPCEEIARKIGRKVVYKDKPLIPGIVFIRTRATEINAIMRSAGDIAWCMRDTSRADRRYAIVSQRSMETFQQVIGQFTPDYQLYPLGTHLLKPEDRVVIIGGDYSGTEAIVEKSPKDYSGDIIYQIRFIDDTGFEWHIPKDQRLLKKID